MDRSASGHARFVFEHIKTRPADSALQQGPHKRQLIDDGATRNIHYDAARTQGFKNLIVHEMMCGKPANARYD